MDVSKTTPSKIFSNFRHPSMGGKFFYRVNFILNRTNLLIQPF